jgi:hypothetical protein
MVQPIVFELVGGPCDGGTVCLDRPPYEILVPLYDDLSLLETDPDSCRPVKYYEAVYCKVTDKNQYQYTEARTH